MTGLRERKKRLTHERLMHAAIRLIAERGFDHVTVDDIVAEVDVSPSTFFRYFESKAGAVFGNAASQLASLQSALDDRPAGTSVLDAFEGHWLRAAAVVYDDPDVYHAQHEIAAHCAPVAAERSRAFDVARSLTIHALLDERPDRPIVEVEMVASMMVSAIFTALRIWHERGGDVAEIFRECLRVVDRIG